MTNRRSAGQTEATLSNRARRRARVLLGPGYFPAQRAWRSLCGAISPSMRRRRRATRSFVREHGLTVRAGPFAGMTYVEEAVELVPSLTNKLLGCFECELHDTIERVIAAGHTTIVDVGAAHGYYAVGLARACPRASVVAFECSRKDRALLAKQARANAVDGRIRIEGACDAAQLRSIPLAGAFLKVDCEGCELELLRPDVVPELTRATILVEIHEFLEPGVRTRLVDRFAASHDCELIRTRERDPRDYPELRSLDERDARTAVSELRPGPMDWALLRPRPRRSR